MTRVSSVLLALAFATVAFALSAPYKVIYIDDGNWNSPQTSITNAAEAGFNVIILAFYMHTGPSDFLTAWEGLSTSTKTSTVSTLHSKGAVLLVSFGGGADANPYTLNAYSTGETVGKWAKNQHLDGVDFDLENYDQGFTVNGHSATWTIHWAQNITKGAAAGFGSGGVYSHAPQSPYFGKVGATDTWAGSSGGYTAVYEGISDLITFLSIQYYNQGGDCYTDYTTIFTNGNSNGCGFPGTSIEEIKNEGIPYSKLVVGKPVHSGDAGDGYVSASTLKSYFSQAKSQLGWDGGVMGWEWTDDGTTKTWIQTIDI